MNLEVQSAGKPTMNGLMGISTKTDNSRISQSESNQKSAQFKELLNQSKQDIKQADRQLESQLQKQQNTQEVEDGQKSDSEQTSQETHSKDTAVMADDLQLEEDSKELLIDGEQKDDSVQVLENPQMMNVQNIQAGLEAVAINFSFGVGLEENDLTGDAVVPSQSADLNGQSMNNIITEEVSQVIDLKTEESQILETNSKTVEFVEQSSVEALFPQLIKNSKAEALLSKETTETNSELDLNQTNVVGNRMMKTVNIQNQSTSGDNSQSSDTNTENVATQKVESETDGETSLELFTSVPPAVDGVLENSTLLQTSDQNLGEKGIQGIQTSSINLTKGIEVQGSNSTSVAQQVEQKILQNFEPNKPIVLQMTLSPENLGEIEVQLKYSQGELVIDILAASRETQNLLGKQINQLVRGLALQNVHVESVHLNTPVEASGNGGNAALLMDNGSDFTQQQQNNAQLRENFLKNSSIQKNLLSTSDDSNNGDILSIAQNLQYNGYHKINYLV